ncbi:MAG: hypothetical protein HLUCCX14_00725 [Marinobacter excellens HL-55]|uniref:Lipoprotein n=1 Tax=Marinobacter excellens HL-55 TaxID=1305731 RepID=A0A0P7YKC2_9GAMM|nr:MAG: hypothetical protein HLUCCX14_00725 [Marinobacter excellens HL-55]
MKFGAALFLTILLTGCATSQTTISYSGDFNLQVPTKLLSGSTVFTADGLSVGWPEGNLISGIVITKELESLPSDFDLKDYPKYLFNIKNKNDLDKKTANVLKSSTIEIDHSFGIDNLTIKSKFDTDIYSACKDEKCIAFIIKNNVTDHLLSLYSQGITEEELISLAEGI